jgi:uncharacterized membrane protein YdjX (TVP38/TMEM64 family)
MKKGKKTGVWARRTIWGSIILSALLLAVARIFWLADIDAPAVVNWVKVLSARDHSEAGFLLAFGVVTTLALPAVLPLIAAGALWPQPKGFLLAWLAGTIWINVHFLIGRVWGRRHLHEFLARRGFEGVLQELEGGGVLATIVVRQLPLPFLAVNLAAGASPLRWRRWFVGNLVGILPASFIYTELSSSLIAGLEGARTEAVIKAGLAGLGLMTLALGSRIFLSYWRRVRSAKT